MTTHKLISLAVFTFALASLPMTFDGAHRALADDSETMDANSVNTQQYDNFPNQGYQVQRGQNQGADYQRGWYQGNQNQGYANQGNRTNQDNGDQESRSSRFSRDGQAERGGGARGGRDGGGDGGGDSD